MIEKLLKKLDSDHSNSDIKKAAYHLLEALNDYPKYNLTDPDDLIKELQAKITAPITFNKLVNYSRNLDPANSAWEMESISSLLEMYDAYKEKSLEEIIALISDYAVS